MEKIFSAFASLHLKFAGMKKMIASFKMIDYWVCILFLYTS